MSDPRYPMPVAGLAGPALAVALQASIVDVETHFPPRTGIMVLVFDFGGGPEKGLGYISNAQRADMVKTLREWLNKEAQKS